MPEQAAAADILCPTCSTAVDAAAADAEPAVVTDFDDNYAGGTDSYAPLSPYQSVYYPYKQRRYWCDYYYSIWRNGR